MQTRWHSLVESLQNIALGYGVAIASQLIIFPMFDIHIPLTDNLWIGFYFTLISLARSFLIRRYNNRKTMRLMAAMKETDKLLEPIEDELLSSIESDEHELINERVG